MEYYSAYGVSARPVSGLFPPIKRGPRKRSRSLPILPDVRHLEATWDGNRHAGSIHQVWNQISRNLMDIRESFCEAVEAFYENTDRMTYIASVNQALQVVCRGQTEKPIADFLKIEEMLKINTSSVVYGKQMDEAQQVLKNFMDRTKAVSAKLSEVNVSLEEDAVKPLEAHCSKHPALGIADDEFFKALKIKTASIRTILNDFEQIIISVNQSLDIPKKHFSDKDFSKEVASELDCEAYPLLRFVPDLVQKVEAVLDIAHDWLRSDKVYLEHLQKEVDSTMDRLRDMECHSQVVRLEYDRVFVLLQEKNSEFEELDENFDNLWKGVSKLEAAKAAIEMEISATASTLHNCRDKLKDLGTSAHALTSDEEDSEDEVDEATPGLSVSLDMTTKSRSLSAFKSRLCREARTLTTKLEYLQRKKKRVEKKITYKKNLIKDLETAEEEVELLSKRLRSIGKKKSKLSEQTISLNAHLELLRHTLESKLHPTSVEHVKYQSPDDMDKQPHRRRRSLTEQRELTGRTILSEALHRAFRTVKNSIGHNWKDLIRVLPNCPSKMLADINNEIRVIEYENQGQLKEQAYQAMVNWHNHNGRRATLQVLRDSLREINENRLADHVDKELVTHQWSLVETQEADCHT